MPRSVPAYPQNAVVTHSPANAGSGSTSSAVDQGNSLFQLPPGFDVCAPVTQNGQNPFMAGLNTMGDGENHTGVAGQTGNILSGLQLFTDSLCGFATGGTTVSEVLDAARNLRRRGGNLHETIEAIRRLRDTVGTGTTPQSVLGGVEAVTGLVNANPLAQSAIQTGQAAVGISGNQIIDSINGSQAMANQGHQLLTGQTTTGASGTDLLDATGHAINQNTSNHTGHTSSTTAQSVNLVNQNLLVAQDFAHSYNVNPDPTGHWAWDGSDGDSETNVLGCLKCVVDGTQPEYVSNEIPVFPGENIEVAATVKWESLAYTGGSPLMLGVEKYRQMKTPDGGTTFVDIGWYTVATVDHPGAHSSGYAGANSDGFVGIAGVYTGEPGVDQIRMRFQVADNGHGGTVKFDNGDFLKLDLIADAAVPGVGTTVDNIVTGLYGAAGSGFSHNEAAVALANTAAALTSVSSQVASLSAEGHTGSIAGDDFNWSGPILSNPNWGGFYIPPGFGGYEADGTDAVWVPTPTFPSSSVVGHFDWQGTDSTSTTDYQLVQVVLDGGLGVDVGHGAYSSIWLLGRVASDWSSWVRLSIASNGSYHLLYLPSGGSLTSLGSPIELASGTCSVPGAGSVISFYCGDKTSSTPRRFKAQIGTTVLFDFTEVGSGSIVGSSNRGYGWGGGASWYSFFGQTWVVPAKVNQWLGIDQ